MLYKDFDDIQLQDIESLYSTLNREIRTVEYKRVLELDTNDQKKEFLADISSFANSSGGDIYFGIDELNGICGFEIDKIDGFILKIEQIIRDGIEPRIAYRIKDFNIFENKFLIFIRVNKSYNSPHQVKIFGWEKYFSRAENGKFKLDVYQLKHSFLNTNSAKLKINEFVIDRVSNVISDNTPIKLNSNPKIIFHAIPIPSFIDTSEFHILPDGRDFDKFRPLSSSGDYGKRINFDGLVTYSGNNSYLQIFRNGSLESVDVSIISPQNSTTGEKIIPVTLLEDKLIEGITTHLELINKFNADYPIALFLNIIGISGYSFGASNRWEIEKVILDRNHLKFEELIVETKNEPVVKILKPWFDRLWQAFNYEYSTNYFSETEWRGMGKIRT